SGATVPCEPISRCLPRQQNRRPFLPGCSKTCSIPEHARGSATRRQNKSPFCGAFVEPSSGLEPETPSLPCDSNGNWWQPVATVRARSSHFRPFGEPNVCHRLRPLCSITVPSQSAQKRALSLRATTADEVDGGPFGIRVDSHRVAAHRKTPCLP